MAVGEPSIPLLPFVEGANELISESEQIFASKISYSNVVQGQINKGQCHENYYHQLDSDLISLKPTSIYQGKPAVVFKIADKKALLGNLKHILVGKFSRGRPPLTIIRTFFASLKLHGNYNLSLLDNKHLAIECECKSDFIRLWLKLTWSIQGRPMRIFKWESDFTPIKESSLAPVWVRFVGIPLYMFDVNTLFSISNCIGKPLRVDPINVNRMNLRSARVCVELDVAKPFIDSIWVYFEDDDSKEVLEGFWVKAFYDVVPPYCIFCSHIGHAMEECKRNKADELNVTSQQIGVVANMGQLSDNNSMLSRAMNHADMVFDGLPQPEFFKKRRQVVYKKVWHPIMSKEHCVGVVKGHASVGKTRQVQQNICTEMTHQISTKSGSPRQNKEAIYVESDAQVEEVAGLEPIMQVSDDMYSENGAATQRKHDKIVVQAANVELIPGCKSVMHTPNASFTNSFNSSGTKFEEEQIEATEQISADLEHQIPEPIMPALNGEATHMQTNYATWTQQIDSTVAAETPMKQVICDIGIAPLVDLDKVNCTENKDLVLVLDHNVSEIARKVNAFLKDVEDLKQKIDNADSTTLARFAASPATKTFLQYQVKHHTFSPLPMFDLVEPVDIQDPSYEHIEDLGRDGNKKDPTKNRRDRTCWADLENDNDLLSMELEGQVTSKVSDNGHLITILPKLCYEQVSKRKAWSTTVQIAQFGEGPGIVKTALLQLKDKRRITETRGQGLPFDDHG